MQASDHTATTHGTAMPPPPSKRAKGGAVARSGSVQRPSTYTYTALEDLKVGDKDKNIYGVRSGCPPIHHPLHHHHLRTRRACACAHTKHVHTR